MTDLAKIAARNTLLHAIQRAMFCPVCGHCLDVRSAVYVEATSPTGQYGSAVTCAACFDRKVQRGLRRARKAFVVDGRTA